MQRVRKSTVIFTTLEPSNICSYVHDHPNVILLDVRTKEEFDGAAPYIEGKLNNAINIPLQQLQIRMQEIINLKDSEIIVYCSHSHRSPQASYILNQNGFSKIINMNGGMSKFTDSSCKY